METPDSNLPELTKAKLAFIERLALYYEGFGIPRIAGRMFGLFLVTTQPLSAEHIAAALEASLSSISTNIRAIIANGWVEKVTVRGERTSYYRLATQAWQRVLERRRQALMPLKDLADSMLADLSTDDPAEKQLQDMSAWANFLVGHYEVLIKTWNQEQK